MTCLYTPTNLCIPVLVYKALLLLENNQAFATLFVRPSLHPRGPRLCTGYGPWCPLIVAPSLLLNLEQHSHRPLFYFHSYTPGLSTSPMASGYIPLDLSSLMASRQYQPSKRTLHAFQYIVTYAWPIHVSHGFRLRRPHGHINSHGLRVYRPSSVPPMASSNSNSLRMPTNNFPGL